MLNNLLINIHTAPRPYFVVVSYVQFTTMVAHHVVQWNPQQRGNIFQVVVWQVATAQHQIHVRKTRLDAGVIHLRRDFVTECQDLHCLFRVLSLLFHRGARGNL